MILNEIVSALIRFEKSTNSHLREWFSPLEAFLDIDSVTIFGIPMIATSSTKESFCIAFMPGREDKKGGDK